MRLRAAWIAVLVCPLWSCGQNSSVSKPPEFAPAGGQGKCSVKGGQLKPLIVEWPSGARGDLELRARRGIVAVRYVGCEMEVLPRCSAPGAYKYSPFTAKGDKVIIRNEDELYANIPIGAASLEAKLQNAGQLTANMTLVGKYEADRDQVRKDELRGVCEGATHYVAGLTVGAFEFFAGTEAEVGGGAAVVGIGAGARHASIRENLTHDGNADACGRASQEDPRPPAGCGAILRLEVASLGESLVAATSCPPGFAWNGTQCVPTATARPVECPTGANWDGSRCVASAAQASSSTLSVYQAAAEKLERECELYGGGYCLQAGLMFDGGVPEMRDRARAVRVFRRACEQGLTTGCDALRRLGETAPKPRTLVDDIADKCDQGDSNSCLAAGNMYAVGMGTEKNRDKAIEYHRKGCRLGETKSCEYLRASKIPLH